MTRRFLDLKLALTETGDNFAATFSPELAVMTAGTRRVGRLAQDAPSDL